jgi:iron(III) transport system substrate-binding protein
VNRDIVSEQEFTKMEDLLNPKWKGKIAMYDPRQRGFINIIFARFLDSLGEAGIKKLLTEQAPVYASSPAQLAEWAVRGSYPIIIGMGISERNRFVADGLGTKLRGVPGTEIVTNGWGNLLLVNKSPNPNAATVFINWMLSKEAQEDWVKRSNLNSRRIDVPNGNPDHHVEQAQQWLDGRLYNTETGAGKTEISIQIANDAMK